MDVLPQLVRAVAGGRARSAPPPEPARLRELARALERGDYSVPAERLAEAVLRAFTDPPALRD